MPRVYRLALLHALEIPEISALNRYMRIEGPLYSTPINPFQQHRQLSRSQTHRSMGSLWPDEPSSLQSLREQTQPIARPPEDLDSVASPTPKDEELTRERILRELCLNQGGQSVESLAHVRGAGG
jgi:hypothetical protein